MNKSFCILMFVLFLFCSCSNREEQLNKKFVDMSYPIRLDDNSKQKKLAKIHRRLFKIQPENSIYLTNLIQANCRYGKYDENIKLIQNSDLLSEAYKNFYIALNLYRQDTKSNYQDHLELAIEGNLPDNPLIAYISAHCSGQQKFADEIYPFVIDFIQNFPERNGIFTVINQGDCNQMLELFFHICPICISCLDGKYKI